MITLSKPIVIIGPTASGKSSLALQLAQKVKGSIINADAMQIYKDLSLITARPTEDDTKIVPHLLYGYADAYTQGSVQDWLTKVIPIIQNTKNPIIVGGTGLYLSSLINGINEVPEVDPKIRELVRNMPIEEVRAKVIDCQATDPQRLRRSLEVQLSVGKPLSFFTKMPKKKLIDTDFQVVFISPPRELLYERCEKRFIQMLEQGGIDEVRHLMTLQPTGGILKAIGVPEIISYLNKNISYDEMCRQAILSTRHYAKRQITWFRHQIKSDVVLSNPNDFSLDEL